MEDLKAEKPAADKAAAAKETEAGAEISALVNYIQPVHFTSFENAKSNDFRHQTDKSTLRQLQLMPVLLDRSKLEIR